MWERVSGTLADKSTSDEIISYPIEIHIAILFKKAELRTKKTSIGTWLDYPYMSDMQKQMLLLEPAFIVMGVPYKNVTKGMQM